MDDGKTFKKITIYRYRNNIDLYKIISPENFLYDFFEFNLMLKCNPIWEDIYLNPAPFGCSKSSQEWLQKMNSIGKVVSISPLLWAPSSNMAIKKISNSLSSDPSAFFFKAIEDINPFIEHNKNFNVPELIEKTLFCLNPREDSSGFEIYTDSSVYSNVLNTLIQYHVPKNMFESGRSEKHLKDIIELHIQEDSSL